MLKLPKQHQNRARLTLGTLVSLAGIAIVSVASVSALSEANREKFAQNDIVFYDPDGTDSSTQTPTQTTTPCTSSGTVSVSGGTGEQKIWNGLTSFLTDEQAAGIMGNMYSESHLNPAQHEMSKLRAYQPGFDLKGDSSVSYGIGLTQWSYGRRTNFLSCWILNEATCNNKYSRPEDYSDLYVFFTEYSRYSTGYSESADTFVSKATEDGRASMADRLIASELVYIQREINKSYKELLNKTTVADATKYFLWNYEKPAYSATTEQNRISKAQAYYDAYHGTSNQTGTGSEDCTYGDDLTITSGETGGQIAEVAAKMSWPVQTGQGDDTHAGQCQKSDGTWVTWNDSNKDLCKDNPRPTYKTAKTSNGVGGYLQDCGRFVTTVLYAAGLDEGSLPKTGSASTVTNWLASSSKWVELENTGKSMNLQPGDIFANSQHVSVYIGSYGGSYGANAAASWQDWVGRITKYTSSSSAIVDGKWSSQGETKLPFRIFRYNAGTTGGETPTGETPTGETPTGETPTGEDPTGGETPTGESPTETPTGTTGDCSSGCGLQNPSSLVSQGSYSDNWKTKADKDVKTSGCSLIAVVNAAIALGKNTNVSTVASWSYNTKKISSAGWTTSVSPIATYLGLNLGGELYSSEGTLYQTKLSAVKKALSEGKVIIASGGGSGSGRSSISCNSSEVSSGLCVFSPGGHFITIVGVTSDNKLIVGNPAKGSKSGQNWTFPAENVLKFSNKAKAVSL